MLRREFIGYSVSTAGLLGMPAAAAGPAASSKLAHHASISAAVFHASRRFAQTSFGKIAYIERGTGRAALFLHGFPLNGFQWRGVLAPLSELRRCIAPDFLALGYTEVRPGQDVGPDAQVAMLAEFLDALDIAKVDLVANDSGGAIAQLFLVRYPHRVRTLLLTNCDTEIECPPAALVPVILMAHAGTFADRWLASWLADKPLGRSAEGLGGQCYADPSNPTNEAIDCYLQPLLNSPQRKDLVHAYAISLENNFLTGIESGLRLSKAPTRIVWGGSDRIFSRAGAAYLHRTMGSSRGVRQLRASKLFWPEERPEVIIAEAQRLWAAA
ncbi:MAG: alpha/beta hydrolase [Herbaspirillum sp.]|nr:alpha/beta hydrolase [Herbaspirillum sp.]